MSWPRQLMQLIELEAHFGGRSMRCFKDRPDHLAAMFDNAVALNGEGEALVSQDVRLSYRQLDELTHRLSTQLRHLGITKGDRIALLIGNRPAFVYVLIAAIRLGAIAVPINVREQTPGLEHILNDCGARLLVHDLDIAERLPDPAALPALEVYLCADGETRNARSLDCLLNEAIAGIEPADPIAEEDVAVILYTSGTTGRPKGAMLTHFNIIHSVMHFAVCMELTAQDRSVTAVPASHVTGLVANLFTMIYCAGCSIMLERFEAVKFLQLAARERMTHTIIVPAMYNLCLLRGDFDHYALDAWRIGGYGGAPMPEATIAALADRLPGLFLVNAYGSTEVTSPATMMPMGFGARMSDSVGLCVPCGDIRIVDENGNDVGAGDHGEIWIAGPMVVPGYWRDPDRTAAAFENGYWKSGDMGSRDEAGFIRLYDRKKDMIIRGGYNIYSAEVENAAASHPDIVECAVIGVPDPVLGEKTKMFVVSKGSTLTAEDVCAFCAKRLADYKIPDHVEFVAQALPRNANGKLMKNKLEVEAPMPPSPGP